MSGPLSPRAKTYQRLAADAAPHLSPRTKAFLRLAAETAPLESGCLALGTDYREHARPPVDAEEGLRAVPLDEVVLLDRKFKPDPVLWAEAARARREAKETAMQEKLASIHGRVTKKDAALHHGDPVWWAPAGRERVAARLAGNVFTGEGIVPDGGTNIVLLEGLGGLGRYDVAVFDLTPRPEASADEVTPELWDQLTSFAWDRDLWPSSVWVVYEGDDEDDGTVVWFDPSFASSPAEAVRYACTELGMPDEFDTAFLVRSMLSAAQLDALGDSLEDGALLSKLIEMPSQ